MNRSAIVAKPQSVSLLVLIAVVAGASAAILFDVPVLRQVLAVASFAVMPGWLLLYIFKLDEIELLKRIVLAIGLSLAFLIFAGLAVNQLLPLLGIAQPLSPFNLVVSFGVVLVILGMVAWKVNPRFRFPLTIKKPVINRDRPIWPLASLCLFPALSFWGTHNMETTGNNTVLMIMLFLIPAYVALVAYHHEKIPKIVYPVAIVTIAISLLLMHGLPSNFLNGTDTVWEYYVARVIETNQHWTMGYYPSTDTATLSISFLPVVVSSLLGVKLLYVFKIIYPLLFSTMPLCIYIVCKKYLSSQYAFLAAFFSMAQIGFIYTIQDSMKQGIALVFFWLAIMVLFDDEIKGVYKKAIFIIFSVSVVVSHYSSAYILLFVSVVAWLILKLGQLIRLTRAKNMVTIVMATLISVVIFLWYSQLTGSSSNVEEYFVNTFRTLQNIFIEEYERGQTWYAVGAGTSSIFRLTRVIINNTALGLIAIGVLSSVVLVLRRRKSDFEIGFLIMMVAALVIAVLLFILPYIAAYGAGRYFQTILIFFAPAFVVGGLFISRRIRFRRIKLKPLVIIMIPLILFFFSSTYIIDQFYGIPTSPDLNRSGYFSDKTYTYEEEVAAGRWLQERNRGYTVYSDSHGGIKLKVALSTAEPPLRASLGWTFFRKAEPLTDGYLYLTQANVVQSLVYPLPANISSIGYDIATYYHLYEYNNKIYSNGASEIYR